MADSLYRAHGFALQELPRHLRNGAANNGSLITVDLPAPAALRLAEIIEEQANAPIAVVEVARTPARIEWLIWTVGSALLVFDLLDAPCRVLAAYFTGLFHG